MNEARNFSRSNLTKVQRDEAQAAILGLGEQTHMATPDLTPQEIERMRQIVMQHDRVSINKEFDLNAPPKQPYKHQEFPKAMHAASGDSKVVHSKSEQEEAEAEGYSDIPPVPKTKKDKKAEK